MRLRLKNLNKIRDNKYWINKEREAKIVLFRSLKLYIIVINSRHLTIIISYHIQRKLKHNA